jgi:hypothetical protein
LHGVILTLSRRGSNVQAPRSAAAPPPPRTVSDQSGTLQLRFSRPYVIAGEVTVQLNNQGMDSHNLNLRLVGGEKAPLQVGEAGPARAGSGASTYPRASTGSGAGLPQHDEWA